MEAFDQDYYKNLTYMLEHPSRSPAWTTSPSRTSMCFGLETNVELARRARRPRGTTTDSSTSTCHRAQDDQRHQGQIAFTRGFRDIVPHDVIKILNPSELELLISGTPEIDLDDLRANTEYRKVRPERAAGSVVLGDGANSRRRTAGFSCSSPARARCPWTGSRPCRGSRAAEVPDPQGARGRGQAAVRAHVLTTSTSRGSRPRRNSRKLLFAIREGARFVAD